MTEPVTNKNCSPDGSDFTDSEWSLTFPDDAEKTRVLTPEPTFRDAPQKASPLSMDDERYQSFHPNFEFTRDFTPRSTASTYYSSGSRYIDDVYESHRFDIIGHSSPPIRAVFDTIRMGHTSDKSWSSNQSYCLTESTTSSDSSQFVSLPRPGTSSGQISGLKGNGQIRPFRNSSIHPTQGVSTNDDSHKKQCSLPRAERCLPPSNVPQGGQINEKKKRMTFTSPERVYVYEESGSDRHRASTLKDLFSDKEITASDHERERLRSASSRSSSSRNSQKRSLIPVRTMQDGITMSKRANTKKVSKGEKNNDTLCTRKNISITSPESVYVFQESGSDRHRASTLEGLFSDSEINSSEYESEKPRFIPNKTPTCQNYRQCSQIPLRKTLSSQNKKHGTTKAGKSKELPISSPESVYVFEESGSERHRASTLEGLFSETEENSSDYDSENPQIASSKVVKNRHSTKRSKLPQRITPPDQQHLYLDKVAFICGASNDAKVDKCNRLRESASVTSPESVYVFEESGSDRHRASTLEGLFSDSEVTSSEYENRKPRTPFSIPKSDRNFGKPNKIPLRFTPPRHETFLDRIAYICGAAAPLRNVSNASTTKNKTIPSSEATTEMLKNKKRDESGKNSEPKILKPQSKINDSLVITSFQKRKNYETKRKAEMKDSAQKDERKSPPAVKKKRDAIMNKTVDLDLQKMKIGKPVDVQNNHDVEKSVDVHKPLTGNLGVPANGFKMVRPDAYDKSHYRYVAATEQQDFSSLQSHNSADYECSTRDILDYKPSFGYNQKKNYKPVSFVDTSKKKMVIIRTDNDTQINRESAGENRYGSTSFSSTTGKNILPPIPSHAQKPVDMNRFIPVNGKLKREYNGGIPSMEKEKSGENRNVLYNSSHKNKHSSYTHVAPQKVVQGKVAKAKNVICSVVVNSLEKATAGYVPGYGPVRVNPASVKPVLKTTIENPRYESCYDGYTRHTGRKRVETRGVSGYRPTPGEVSGSVKLPPINSRQIADSRSAKGKKASRADIQEYRAKAKPLNTGVGKGLSRELHRQYPMFY